ncbi:hypothetical protein NIES4074_36190 [Cylindrospermum sp. NIES-4074]|nr:hypothetical protein NIES4074_36190 [Cylindrospermum sp. NIES-4074]
MPVHQIVVSSTISLTITSASGTGIMNFPSLPAIAIPNGMTKVCESIQIDCITCNSIMVNLPIVGLPNIPIEASRTEELYAGLDLEWKSARIQMNCLLTSTSGTSLQGAISLLNTGYPFRQHDLIAIYKGKDSAIIGENAWLAFQIKDVGSGVLGLGDSITITADFNRTISIFEPQLSTPAPIVNNYIDLASINDNLAAIRMGLVGENV